jgi:hypothetical protein
MASNGLSLSMMAFFTSFVTALAVSANTERALQAAA